MFSKASTIFGLLVLASGLASATPPACLLAAVNTEPNPSDLSIVCGANSGKVMQQISSLCNGSSNAAMSAYTSICSASGFSVASTALPNNHTAPTISPAMQTSLNHITGSSSARATVIQSMPIGTGRPGIPINGTYTRNTSASTGSTGPAGFNANTAGFLTPSRVGAFASLALIVAGLATFI